MSRWIMGAALMAALSLPPAAWAQDDTADPAPDAAETAPAAEAAPATDAEAAAGTEDGAPNPAEGLSMGEDVSDEAPSTGPAGTYVAEVHGDWERRCVRAEAEGGAEICQLYQLLQDQSGNPVAEISFFALPDGAQAEAGATIITPLETFLPRQITMAIDGGAAKRYPFEFCASQGCFSRVGFTASEVQQFKRGNAANMVIFPAAAPEQPIELTISLSGFTAGYDTVAAGLPADPAE